MTSNEKEFKTIKIRRQIITSDNKYTLPIGTIHYIFRPEFANSSITTENGFHYFGNKKNKFIIYPNFYKNLDIGENTFSFFLVTKDKDLIDCQNIILNEHYLKPPNRGMYLACSLDSKIIGCCVIDELSYGNPKGRFHISEEIRNQNGWTLENWNLYRRDIVQKKLNVCWLSRIAVNKKFKGIGIGNKMLTILSEIIKSYHPMNPNFIEVIATYMKSGINCFNEDSNVFCKSTYNYYHLSNFTHRTLNPSTGFYEPHPGIRTYFWKDTNSDLPKRLFVPLSNDPFNWFVSGSKEWELRKSKNQYTSKNVYKGKLVELRKGYNTTDRLYGLIDEVIESTELENIFELIDFKKIIPIASDVNDALKISRSILNPKQGDSFIAFKVISEQKDIS